MSSPPSMRPIFIYNPYYPTDYEKITYQDIEQTPLRFKTMDQLIFIATEKKKDSVVEFLKNCLPHPGFAFDKAITYGNFEVVRFLHHNYVKGNTSPLIMAADVGNVEIAKYLLSKGYEGEKLGLEWAAFNGHEEMVDLLAPMVYSGCSDALDLAASKGRLNIVKKLLDRGHKISIWGLTRAKKRKHLEVLECIHNKV